MRISLLLIAFPAVVGPLRAQVIQPHIAPAGPRATLRQLGTHLGPHGAMELLDDFTGDGAPDFIARTPATFGNDLYLYVNDANGVFERRGGPLPPSLPSPWRGFSVGDLDGDGDLDLLDWSGQVLRNLGTGIFVADRAAVPDSIGRVDLGDLDGDGDLDGLARASGNFLLLLNDGTGSFSQSTGPVGSGDHYVLGDVDGDLDLDAFVVGFGNSQTTLFLNDGSGGFSDASAGLPTQASTSTSDIALGDLNGDSKLDAVLATSGGNALWIGQGDGTFLPASLPTQNEVTAGVALFDTDGDSDLDIYFQNVGAGLPGEGNPDQLLINQGGAVFQDGMAGLSPVVGGSSRFFQRDVDGDGDTDLMIRGRLHFGDGKGNFVHANGGVPGRWGVSDGVALADLNGDQYLDAIVAGGGLGDGPEASRLYFGDGAGRFTDASSNIRELLNFHGRPPLARDVAVGDVDGDGDLDLVFAGANYGGVLMPFGDNHLFLNDGLGDFLDTGVTRLPLPQNLVGLTVAVRMADIEGDGDLDIVFGNRGDYDGHGEGFLIYRNDGTGFFTDVTATMGPGLQQAYGVLSFELVDLDGDSDLDIVAGMTEFGIKLIINQAGLFSDNPVQLPHPFISFLWMLWTAVEDFDGDGDQDIAGVGIGRQRFLFLNDGTGTFIEATGQLPPSISRGATYLGGGIFRGEPYGAVDIDSDGDIDLVGPTRIFENDGNANFVDRGIRVYSPPDIRGVAFADLDEDGDLDAYWAREDQDVVGSNTIRHLAARGIPRLGKPLAFEVYGPSEEAWGLGLSPTRTRVQTALGLLQLGGPLSVVAGGLTDRDGRAVWAANLPANPALVGIALYWQALVGSGSPMLTNVEGVVLTSF